jgi:hypothetical protein
VNINFKNPKKKHILGYNAVYCVESQPIFQRKVTPTSSGSKNKTKQQSSVKQVESKAINVLPKRRLSFSGIHCVLFAKCSWTDRVKKDEMGGACGRLGGRRYAYGMLVGGPEGGRPLVGRDVGGWTVLGWNLERYGGMMWLGMVTGGGLMWARYWAFRLREMLGGSRVAARLAAPQGGLSSVTKQVHCVTGAGVA